jgi:putative nucleotidyltransferase with HDIG domain
MLERVENSLRDLLSSLQMAKLYATEHPRFKKSVDKVYASLQDVLKEKPELIIGIVQEELAFENEILFDLSNIARPVILYLKQRGIERISFYHGLEKEELEKFISFLAFSKTEIKDSAQEHLILMGIRNITVGKLKDTSSQEPAMAIKAVNILSIYDSSLEKVSNTFTEVLNNETVDTLTLRFSLNNILENLSNRYREIMEVVTLKRYNLETYIHLLNVSVLTMYFSSKIGFDKNDVLDMGVAALFHDIGKLYISRKILRKDEKLTVLEFDLVKSHTTLGAELLLRYIDNLGILPVVVSFEHHLRYDLSGYPKLPFIRMPHISSLIVSICDFYDALSQRRSYRADYPPNLIYELMMKEKGTLFEPSILEKFFKVMGVWPIGAIVSLNDGCIAIVRDENEDDILSPWVEIIYPSPKEELINLSEKKESLKIVGYLNPWKEGKDYLHLVNPDYKKS